MTIPALTREIERWDGKFIVVEDDIKIGIFEFGDEASETRALAAAEALAGVGAR